MTMELLYTFELCWDHWLQLAILKNEYMFCQAHCCNVIAITVSVDVHLYEVCLETLLLL